MWDANHDPADYGENFGRGKPFARLVRYRRKYSVNLTPKAVACEVLARRIVHQAPPDRVTSIMSTRLKHRQIDGEESDMSSALELAIDSHWYVLSDSGDEIRV